IYSEDQQKASGVRIIDAETQKTSEYFAKVIFVNASTIASNQILLNSKSKRFPNGLGNDSGLLGKYIAFHNYLGSISASIEGFEDMYYYGRRPTQPIIPNFRNVERQGLDVTRGYASLYGAYRGRGGSSESPVGGRFKDSLSEVGAWCIGMMMQGETSPREENHVRLSPDLKDKLGMAQLILDVRY